MRSVWLWISLVLVLPIAADAADAAAFRPIAVETFFITPDEPATLRWEAEGELAEAPEYALRDYREKVLSKGRAKLPAARVVELGVRLPQGYYEVEFPAAAQRCGVVSLPAWKGKPDPFFAIDGALSWLVRDEAVRRSLVKDAQRCGIGMVRERLTWGAVHPREGAWDWEGGVRFDTLRRTYKEHGIEVLEMAHDAPAWQGKVAKYPRDLVAAARSWREIKKHWRSTWGALEIWNEPDIFFGGDLPADQYAAVAKAIAYAMPFEEKRESNRLTIVGGVMAHCNEPFLQTLAENGLLGSLDAFSFHTYDRAMDMESLTGRYRAWLTTSHAPGMPLWLTECGRPCKRGPARPPADQDAVSALDITMKAVESRACGIARYFAFVYPYYEENDNNFGMMGREATPLRSMAAYAQSIRALAGLDYLGDLRLVDKSIQRARVFGNDKTAVAVLYSGRPEVTAKLKLDAPIVRIEGIDGRVLQGDTDGAAPVSDGMAYVWLDRQRVAAALNSDTPAMRLWEAARKGPPSSFSVCPIIPRLQFEDAAIKPCSAGYRLPSPPPEKLRIAVRVFNLGNKAEELTFRMETTANEAQRLGEEHGATVPAEGFADMAWEIDARSLLGEKGLLPLRVVARGPKGEDIARLAFRLLAGGK